ncbi:MAG TPA: hypothetical protein VMG12_20180 [Polyangiaceae bacterium]|nr:hypothetical protein [Polyangiaceae bacterium]
MAERRIVNAWGSSLVAGGLLASGLLLACAGSTANTNDRYPEEKRPDAPISASDGEVLGAHEQDPADTLEGSLTNEHGAARSPHAEEPAEEARERLEYEECVEANQEASKAALTPGAEARKKPVCPPPPDAKE